MVEIPEILQKNEYRFIPVVPKLKKPKQKDFLTKNNYSYDDPILQNYLKNSDYGILLGGKNNLIAIDIDKAEIYESNKDKIKPTLTVQTGRGYHLYYKLDQAIENQIIKDNDGNGLGEIRSEGYFNVGPNCIHKSGKVYTIFNNREITQLSTTELTTLINAIFPILKHSKPSKVVSSDFSLVLKKEENRNFNPSYLDYSSKFKRKLCFKNPIEVKIFGIVPNLTKQYQHRPIMIFTFQNINYWIDLNKDNQYQLKNLFGYTNFWTGKHIILESFVNKQGQKNTYLLVIKHSPQNDFNF